jgi:hypothetical protein
VTETDARLPAPGSRDTGAGSEPPPSSSRRPWLVAQLLPWPGVAQCAAVAFLIGHLFLISPGVNVGQPDPGVISFLSSDLDDIDAVNFAMGVRRFDVTEHRPHPPGYPLYVLLGKFTMSALSERYAGHFVNTYYAGALGFWGALAGALAAFPLMRLFRLVVDDGRVAAGATLITLTCPLYWFTAGRPLSDVPGLAAALAVQVVLATAFVRQQGWRDREVTREELMSSGRLIVLGALLAGFIIGLRSQSFWLTLPLLALVIADRAGRAAGAAIVGSAVTFSVGVLLWFAPLVIWSGGPARYWTALTSQAGEDIEGVDMLLTSTQPVRRLAFNLYETFVLPWAATPLAIVVLALAVIGVLAMLRTSRRSLVLLAGLIVPYAIFHLLYQENATTRYALPLIPAVALLCARGIDVLARRAAGACAVAIAVAGLWLAVPAVVRAGTPHVPVFQLFGAFVSHTLMTQPSAFRREPTLVMTDPLQLPIVAMHRRLWTETRRAREWAVETGSSMEFPWRLLAAPRGHEWLELVKYWREGGDNPIYFVADPRRTDLALIDPASRQFRSHYGWPFAYASTFVGGARPGEMDWWVIPRAPRWFLAEGWALTPETAGVANQDGTGPTVGQGAVGWVRRRPDALRAMVGGRNLGVAGSGAVRFTATLDGRVIDTWEVTPNPGFFLRTVDVPAGALVVPAAASDPGGAGRFAELRVAATRADGAAGAVAASVEQFNLQTPDAVMFGYDEGWHEDEYNPRTGLRWRWTSERAVLRVWNGARDVRVRLMVESPLQTFANAPIVTLKAGERQLATLTPGDGFTIDVRVPADALAASGGRLTLSTSQVFVPAEHVNASDPRRNDRRRLGLRVWSAIVTAAS